MKTWHTKITALACLLVSVIYTQAQPLVGIKTIGGPNPDYATIQAAISALNSNGTASGGVEFQVAAGHTETAVNLTLSTTTGAIGSPIIFRKNGVGANPLITAGIGTSTTVDGVIKIAGTDYVTFDGIDIYDNPSLNTTNTTRMEWGYAIVKGSNTNGSLNITIQNCTINLQKINTNTKGIYSANHTATSTSALTISSYGGTNSALNLQGNTINNSFNAIYILGGTNALYYDDSIDIGGQLCNKVSDFGGSSTAYGIYATNISNIVIKNDSIIQDINLGSTSATHYGIYIGNSTNTNCIIENNYLLLNTTGSSSTRGVYGIYCLNGTSGNNNLIRINNNTIKRINCAASTTILSAIYTSSTANTEITNNFIDSFTRVGTSGNTQVIYSALTPGNRLISGNVISNVNASGTSAQIRAISVLAGGGTITNNTINSIQSSGTSADCRMMEIIGSAVISSNTITNINHASSTTGECYMLLSQGGNADIWGNTISNIATGGSFLIGIELAGTANEVYQVYRNKISGSSSTNNSCIVSGIRQSGASTANIHNNLIGPLSGGASTTTGNGVNGINIASTTAAVSNIYHNNVYLATTSSGGTNCLLLSASSDASVINNIFVNLSANSSTTTRSACAIRRTSTNISSYNVNSDNNLLYVGSTAVANRFVFTDGTTNFTDLNSYKTFAVNRDQSSISNNVLFGSTNIANAGYLTPLDTSYIESMGKIIPQFSADFVTDNARAQYPIFNQVGGGGIAPDIGAFELDMVFIDLVPPSIVAPALTKSLLSTYKVYEPILISDNSGINQLNPPRLYFKKKSNANTLGSTNTLTTDGWKYVTAYQSGQAYAFTIDYSLLFPLGQVVAGDTIEYFIVAQDNSAMQNTKVLGATLNLPISSTLLSSSNFPASVNNSYLILANAISPYVTIGGIGADYTSITSPGGFFDAVNNGIIDNNVVATITGNLTNENGTIALLQFTEEGFTKGSNTITIQPGGPSLTLISGTNTTGGILRLQDVRRVVIDGSFQNNGRYLHFINTAVTGNRSTLQVSGTTSGGGAQNVIIKNCIVQGTDNTNTGNVGISIGGTLVGTGTGNSQGFSNKFIQLLNNHIYTTNIGVLINGNVAQPTDSCAISGMLFGNDSLSNSIYNTALFVRGLTNSTIAYNTIRNVLSDGTAGVYGIHINSESTKVTIDGNRIDHVRHLTALSVPAYGIYANANTVQALTISNNIITRILAQGGASDFTTAPVGIYLNNGNNSFIVNNTVSLSGNRLNHTTGNAYSACLYIRSPLTNLVVANNIFRNRMGSENTTQVGSNFALATSAASIASLSYINHNIYEVSSPTAGVSCNLAINGSNLRVDLPAWKTFSNQDKQSFWGNPGLINDSVALPDTTHQNCWMANGRGTPLEANELDMYGRNRSTALASGSVDIGAVEFIPTVPPPMAVASALPVANTTTYYTLWNDTIAAINWQTGSTVPSVFELRYHSGTNPPNPSSNQHFNAYWSFVATPASTFDYQLTLYYKPEAMYTLSTSATIGVASLGSGQVWQPIPSNAVTINTTNRQITITGLQSFDPITGTDAANPLPVNLLYFKGNRVNDFVALRWETGQSINFSHFVVQHSTNGIQWNDLAQINALSMSSKASYTYHALHPSTENYYRLKLVDKNGTYNHSTVVYIAFQNSLSTDWSVQLYPNPAKDIVKFTCSNNTNLHVEGVFDITGKNVMDRCEVQTDGLIINQLEDGIYYLLLKNDLGQQAYMRICK